MAHHPEPALRLDLHVDGAVEEGGVVDRSHQLVVDGPEGRVAHRPDGVVARVQGVQVRRADRHLGTGHHREAVAEPEEAGQVGHVRSPVRRAQGDQAVDLGAAAEVLDVGPGDEAALAVADEVGLGRPGLRADRVREGVQGLGRGVDVAEAETRQLEDPDLVAVGPHAGGEGLVGERRREGAGDDDDGVGGRRHGARGSTDQGDHDDDDGDKDAASAHGISSCDRCSHGPYSTASRRAREHH